MGRMYSATIQNQAVGTAPQDLFTMVGLTNVVFRIHSIVITQGSDLGDAQEEGIRITLIMAATAGSGGAAMTEQALEEGLPAADIAVTRNNTTQSTGGRVIHEEQMNNRVGFYYKPTPEERPTNAGTASFVVAMNSTLLDAMNMSATVVWEEIG